MEEEDIERLIVNLRMMMFEAGFQWAVDQAEACLAIDTSPSGRAKAIINAAEAVTVDLAEAEIRAQDVLEVDVIGFTPDDGERLDGGGAVSRFDRRIAASDGPDQQPDRQRRALLAELAERRSTFDGLRRLLDVGE